MKIAFIGDIVGRPGREMVRDFLPQIKKDYGVDFVIANYENASHGFGLTVKNCNELFSYGIDCMTGGNHTWDKKEIVSLFETHNILRPHNYPEGVEGSGSKVFKIGEKSLAVLNIMGHHSMPYVDNAFRCALDEVKRLKKQKVDHIFVDFHAEATSEKRAMMMLLKGQVSAIIGTHTHISTDDLYIDESTLYLSDIGLSGCWDNVIGMDEKAPINQFLTGIKKHYDIPKKCRKILQILIMEFEDIGCKEAVKLKYFDDGKVLKTQNWQ